MEDPQTIIYTGLALLVAFYVYKWISDPLHKIPVVGGPSLPILSFISANNFTKNGKEIITEGYQKYYGKPFRVALWDQWMVVVSGTKMIDDLRKRPDDEFSFQEGLEQSLGLEHTTGRQSVDDPYHVDVIRDKLMKSIAAVLPDMIEELSLAVPEYVPARDDKWVAVDAFQVIQEIVARASGRVFVGTPLCRNRDYLRTVTMYAFAVIQDRDNMRFIPGPLKNLAKLNSIAKKTIDASAVYLEPIIAERRAKMEEHGDGWAEKPNDMLQWLMEEAIPRRSSNYEIVDRLMNVNFGAIHTSSSTVTHALYYLATNPEWIDVLRAEAEPVVAAEGLTKASIGKLWKLDSIMREALRYDGIALLSVTRRAMKDVTLYDGTFLPEGTLVNAALYPIHREDGQAKGLDTFDPWRWSRMREGEGEGMKHQLVNTSLEYLPFGHGKHACPGRFFAANELKSLLVFLILNFDFKVASDGVRPGNIYLGDSVMPDPTAKLMFRKRKVNATPPSVPVA